MGGFSHRTAPFTHIAHHTSHLQSGGRSLPLQGQQLLGLEVLHVHVALEVVHLLLEVRHVPVLAGPVDHHVDVVSRVGHLTNYTHDRVVVHSFWTRTKREDDARVW